jgi:hypothetical protein
MVQILFLVQLQQLAEVAVVSGLFPVETAAQAAERQIRLRGQPLLGRVMLEV